MTCEHPPDSAVDLPRKGGGTDGRLAENILYFARALRAAGIPVGPGSVLDALAAVRAAGVGTREDFYWTLHAVFVKRHEHSVLFDQAFRIFFASAAISNELIAMMSPEMTGAPAQPNSRKRRRSACRMRCSQGAEKIEREKQEIELDARFTVSDREVLQKKDFAQMSAAEIAAGQGRDQAHGAGARRGQDAPPRAASARPHHRSCAARCAPA